MALSLDYLEYRKDGKCEVCFEPAERHHMQTVGMGRDRSKPMMQHFLIASLCRQHHIEIDQIGEKKFSEKYNTNMWEWTAKRLARWLWENHG